MTTGVEMDVRLLGPVQVVVDDEVVDLGGARPTRALVALVTASGRRLTTDQMVDRCFDDDGRPDDPAPALRTAVRRLRRALGDEVIRTHRGGDRGYELDVDATIIDSDRFGELVSAGRAAGDPVAAQTSFRRALDLWRGAPFGDLGDLDWLLPERTRLEELHLVALEGWHDAHLRNGSATEIIASLQAAAAEHPLRERFHRQLMHALYLADRQSEALRVFQDFRYEMIEAGLEPLAETMELEQRIAIGDPSLRASAAGRSLRAYEIEERLGEGAFSIVYRGRQPSVDRPVAIKQIRAELANRPEFIRRFEAEAHLVARLEHPYIVPLYDYWREPGSAYLVMRYLRGGNLESRLFDGRWDLDKTLSMVHQVGDALATAHRAGVVHRDVKPANVLLDEDDNAYLADFGIALDAAEAADPAAALSAGSSAYASPEQLQRLPVGPPADVHGLAIATYEALTGRLPFPDEPNKAAMVQRQLYDPIPPVRDTRTDVPAEVDAVLARATAKSPVDRYQTIEEFIAALDAAAEDSSPAVGAVVGARRTMVAGEERNPYKGLKAFDEADVADFTGRERLVDQLVASMEESRLVAVVGPSGSGKSSVVRAGVLPAVRAGRVSGSARWFITTFIPGPRPFEELETALLRIASQRPSDLLSVLSDGDRGIARGVRHALPETEDQVLLVIDQFEELFTLAAAEETAAFLDALAVAVTEERSRLRVVLTLRADFFDRPLRHDAIGALVRDATVAVLPLAPDELEHAIVDPAHAVGAEFEPGLVAEIAADVADQPGALPLLQYALTELYELRQSGLMTRDAYRKLGGVSGALARRAEDLYDDAEDAERVAVRRVFGRLVSLGEGTEDTRRRALRSELGDDMATAQVIDRYGAGRLLSFDRDLASREPTVEVAHEALLREWPRLREWLDEDRDGLRILRHLHATANEWDAAGRPDAELYRGGRLEGAEELAATSPIDLRPMELAFVDAGVARREAESEAERRVSRRLRRLLVGVGVVAVIALVAGIFAWIQQGRADDNAAEAEAQAELARSNAVEAQAQAQRAEESASSADIRRMVADSGFIADEDVDLALLLAAEVAQREPGPLAVAGLQRALTSAGPYLGTIGAGHDFVAAHASPDGVVTGVTRTDVRRYDLETGAELSVVAFDGEPFTFQNWSAVAIGSELTAVGHADGSVSVVTSDTSRRLEVTDEPVRAVAVSEGSDLVAAAGIDGRVHLVVAASGQVRWSQQALPERTYAELMGEEAFETLDTGLAGFLISVEPIVFGNGPGALAVREGDVLVVAGPTLRSLEIETGEIEQELVLESVPQGFPIPIPRSGVALHESAGTGEIIVAAGASSLVRLPADLSSQDWADVPTGRSGRNVQTVDVAADTSGRIWTVMNNGSLIDTDRGSESNDAIVRTQLGRVSDVAVAPNGRSLLLAGAGGIERISTFGDQLLARAAPAGGQTESAVSTDGSQLAAFTFAGPFPALWYDVDEFGIRPSTFEPQSDSGLPSTAFGFADPLGELVFGVGDDGHRTYDAETGRVTAHFPGTPGLGPSGSPDGLMFLHAKSGFIQAVHDRDGNLITDLDLTEFATPIDNGMNYTLFDPVRPRLLIGFFSGRTVVYSTTEWEPLFTIERDDSGGILAAGYDRATDQFVTRGVDGSIAVRDGDSLEVVRMIPGGSNALENLGSGPYVSPDGELLVTARDGVPRLYHLPTGTSLGRFPHDESSVPGANELGSRLQLTSLLGDHLLLWNLDTDTWPQIACQAAGRNMTLEEWNLYGPEDEPYRATCPQWPSAEDL